jgi:hypothetical protein
MISFRARDKNCKNDVAERPILIFLNQGGWIKNQSLQLLDYFQFLLKVDRVLATDRGRENEEL